MKAYTFELGCPVCGSDLEHVNAGLPDMAIACAVALCPKCRKEVTITVQAVMRSRPITEHGTSRGYQAHIAGGTDPCEDCRNWKIAARGRACGARARVPT